MQYDTGPSWTPHSMILHSTVSYCAESLYTAQSQLQFLQTFAQAFKGTVSKKRIYILNLLKKGYIFHLCSKVLGLIFFLTPRSIIIIMDPPGVFIVYIIFFF